MAFAFAFAFTSETGVIIYFLFDGHRPLGCMHLESDPSPPQGSPQVPQTGLEDDCFFAGARIPPCMAALSPGTLWTGGIPVFLAPPPPVGQKVGYNTAWAPPALTYRLGCAPRPSGFVTGTINIVL